jgi:[acyl-carrier-protein] S-malonyltransferase
MGYEIAQHVPSAQEIFLSAEHISGLPIKQYSFFGDEEALINTSIAQPCLLATNIALYRAFQDNFSLEPSYICGHSAGEYSGLVAAGVLSFDDAIRLIQIRGQLMSNVLEGGMIAIKGTSLDKVRELCEVSSFPGGVLAISNLNAPDQVVLSGDNASLDLAINTAIEWGIRVIPLSVSGPFHSPLMYDASVEFSKHLPNFFFNDTTIPIISNATAKPVKDGSKWINLLQKQLTQPVLWHSSICYLQQQGIDLFVEVGPKQVLTKLIKQISPSATIFNVEDFVSLEFTIQQLKILYP